MPFTSLRNDREKAELRRAELRQVFQRIISLAAAQKVDLLLICGDLYEHRYVRKSTINFICDEFGKISDINIVAIPGNHDPDMSDSYYRCHKWPENLTILSNGKGVVKFEDKGLCIFTSMESVKYMKHSDINIFMAHGTLDLNTGDNTYNPLSSRELEAFDMDYYALGHFHNRIEMAGKRGLAYNPGSPEPLGFDEEGEHGVYISEILKEEGKATQVMVDFKQLNKRNFRNITINPDGCRTYEKLAELVSNGISAAGNTYDLYSVILKGMVGQGFTFDKKLLETHLEERAFFIKIKDETMPEYDFEEICKEQGLRGMFVRRLLEKIDTARQAGDEEGLLVAQKALYFGMEALEQGEVCT